MTPPPCAPAATPITLPPPQQDLPQGNFRELKQTAVKTPDKGWGMAKAALFNYRSWIMCLNYGYCECSALLGTGVV
jgi:ABC-type transporter Mla maintaining outer membrane lipid asymmetry permease subunit MlaE